jgi:hypothetical protein
VTNQPPGRRLQVAAQRPGRRPTPALDRVPVHSHRAGGTSRARGRNAP